MAYNQRKMSATLTYELSHDLKNLPSRIFIDTNVVQYMNDFGEAIFENFNHNYPIYVDSKGKRIIEGTFLHSQLDALRQIVAGIDRTSIEFAVSMGVFTEILEKNDRSLHNWFYELYNYWNTASQQYVNGAFTGEGKLLLRKIQSDESIKSAFSKKDFIIVSDAIELECDSILTCDKFRNRQSWMQKRYGVSILYPTDLMIILYKFQALWF